MLKVIQPNIVRITVTDAHIGWTCMSNIHGDKVGYDNFIENPTLEIQVGR